MYNSFGEKIVPHQQTTHGCSPQSAYLSANVECRLKNALNQPFPRRLSVNGSVVSIRWMLSNRNCFWIGMPRWLNSVNHSHKRAFSAAVRIGGGPGLIASLKRPFFCSAESCGQHPTLLQHFWRFWCSCHSSCLQSLWQF